MVSQCPVISLLSYGPLKKKKQFKPFTENIFSFKAIKLHTKHSYNTYSKYFVILIYSVS